jgi:hypothetical protein
VRWRRVFADPSTLRSSRALWLTRSRLVAPVSVTLVSPKQNLISGEAHADSPDCIISNSREMRVMGLTFRLVRRVPSTATASSTFACTGMEDVAFFRMLIFNSTTGNFASKATKRLGSTVRLVTIVSATSQLDLERRHSWQQFAPTSDPFDSDSTLVVHGENSCWRRSIK